MILFNILLLFIVHTYLYNSRNKQNSASTDSTFLLPARNIETVVFAQCKKCKNDYHLWRVTETRNENRAIKIEEQFSNLILHANSFFRSLQSKCWPKLYKLIEICLRNRFKYLFLRSFLNRKYKKDIFCFKSNFV